MRRIAGGGALGVVAVGSVVGGAGVASAEQTVSSHGVTVTVPDGCDIYLQAGLAAQFPDSGHTQRCLAEKGLSSPAVTDVSTVPSGSTSDDSGSSSTTSSTASSSDGSSTTTTTTSGAAPSTPAPTTSESSTPSDSTTSSAAPAATPVKTESGATSDDPADQPAAPGETKSVPIG